jgi:hypothetical protein
VGAVLDQAAAIDGDEAIAATHRRQAMRDNDDSAPLGKP